MTFAFGDPETAPENTIPLTEGTSNIAPLPDDVIDKRVGRADFALGDNSPGPDVLKDAFANGREPEVRAQAAQSANVDFQQEKLDHVKAAIQQGAPVTDEHVNKIMALGTTPEANPNTVFEDKFAKGMVTTGVIGDPANNHVFQSAYDTDPEGTQTGIQRAIGAASRRQQAQDVLEHAQAAYNQLPWVNWDGDNGQQDKLGDTAKSILGLGMATWVNQRNLLNDAPTNSFLPGSNKYEQIQYLHLLPHDQYKPALMAAAGPGSDLWKTSPSDALDFIKAAVQFGTSDAYVDNVFAIANIGSLLPLGAGAKFASRIIKGAEKAQPALQTVESALANAKRVLGETSKPPNVPAEPVNNNVLAGAERSMDILAQPSTPVTPGYYVPKAGIGEMKTANRAKTASFVPDFTSEVQNGVPKIYNKDGIEVQLSRTPEEGHFPVNVTPGTPEPTFTTREGQFAHNKNTIYVDQKGADRLSKSLDTEGGRKDILQKDNGQYFVGDRDNVSPGKEIRGTSTKVATEPARGLYPVELTDEGPKFGQKITRVDEGTSHKVTLGNEIVSKGEIETRTALADIVKSQAETDPQDMLSKMGQHEAAAKLEAGRILDDTANPVVPTQNIAESIRRRVTSSASPQLYYNDSSVLSKERARRLAETATQTDLSLLNSRLNPARVERMTKQAQDAALDIAAKQVQNKYTRNADAILAQVAHWDPDANLHSVETLFGKKDGTLFDTSAQAEHYKNLQYKLGESATVQQEGNQFYLSHVQHADETQSGVRDTLIVSGNETPRGWWNSLMTTVTGKFASLGSSIRSSAYTVSPFQMNNRVVSTHAPSIMRDAIEEVAKDINALGKWTTNERQEMQTILEHNRDYMSPTGVRGQFYNSALEFETEFNSRFGHMPTEKQIVAYDQFTRLSDLDYTLRELDQLRDKARQGVRNYKFSFTGKDELGQPAPVKTDWINGKLVKDFDPKITPNANVYIMPESRFTTKYDIQDKSPVSQLTDAKLKSGEYQIIQMYDPRSKPLLATTGVKDDIHFAVVSKFEDREIRFGENVEYRPGGHVIYQDQHYMKQPRIGPGTNGAMTHFGDMSFKAFPTERQAGFWIDRYNTARELNRTGDTAGLKAYLDAGNLPETHADWMRMVGDKTIDLDQPFVHTFSGRDTLQSNEALARANPGLKDQFSAYNLSQNSQGEFLQDRGAQLKTIENRGTEANPIYSNVDSRLFDPYTSLQKGLSQIVRSRWMADYRTSAAESWVQEFGLLFDQGKLPIEKLRQNPVYWLYHTEGNIDAGVMKTNPELVTAALTARKNIMNFIGARDEVGNLLDGLQKKMINGIAGYTGEKFASKLEETFLPAILDAPSYARSAAFHAVIGMFNPVQLFQQAFGFAHVLAVSPVHALHSTTAAGLMRMYRYTEDAAILSSAGDKAAAMGWDKGEFLSAVDAWKRSGTHNIGGETAQLNQMSDPTIFRNGGKAFLDKGLMFFKAGESFVRDTSWFTATREWQASNPGKAIDNRAIGEIGQRFQVLSLDMTRASNSALNEGVLSVPTQFWTWNQRFMEQMTGNRLTLAEKARTATVYSALFGVPATLGGISFGWGDALSAGSGGLIPRADYGDIRQYALANGYNVHDKFYQAFSEGIPSMMYNLITGHETSLQRFSPNGTQIADIMDGKKSGLEILGGASGGFVEQAMKTIRPALMYGLSAIKKDSGFPLKGNDLLNLAENVSSFNNAEKAWVAYHTGQYWSKTEGLVSNNIDHFQSFMLALGLNPQSVNDAYTKQDFNKSRKSAQEKLQKSMIEDWTHAFKAGQRGEIQELTDYMARVHSYAVGADLTKAQEMDVYKKAVRGSESLVDSVEQNFIKLNPALQNNASYKLYLENKK